MTFDNRFPDELIKQVLFSLAWEDQALTDSEKWAVECACDAVLYERERCARICENMTWYKMVSPDHLKSNGPEDYAAAIRCQK